MAPTAGSRILSTPILREGGSSTDDTLADRNKFRPGTSDDEGGYSASKVLGLALKQAGSSGDAFERVGISLLKTWSWFEASPTRTIQIR